MSLTYFFFVLLSILAIASAIITISSKHPIRSAMGLVVHFFMLAGIYLTLQAQFVAVMQIIVYAGAIMVLVVFVIMLLNLGDETALTNKYQARQFAGIVLSSVFGLSLVYSLINLRNDVSVFPNHTVEFTTVQTIGQTLYTNYLVQFEAIGILLTAAIVGAVLLAKRKIM